MRSVLSVLSILGLAACADPAMETVGDIDLANTIRYTSFATIDGILADLPQTQTMPTAGTARYDGYLGLALDTPGLGSVDVLMDAEILADFGAGTLSGSFDRPSRADGGQVSGSAALTNGTVAGATAGAAFDGNLRLSGTDYGLAGTFDGTFLGDDASGLSGEVSGGISGSGGPTGALSGTLAARR